MTGRAVGLRTSLDFRNGFMYNAWTVVDWPLLSTLAERMRSIALRIVASLENLRPELKAAESCPGLVGRRHFVGDTVGEY
jgi:hypothetical protein